MLLDGKDFLLANNFGDGDVTGYPPLDRIFSQPYLGCKYFWIYFKVPHPKIISHKIQPTEILSRLHSNINLIRYITASSILIFALPLAVIIFCYYHIFIKLREALKSCKRLKRGANSRAPYHRVTR